MNILTPRGRQQPAARGAHREGPTLAVEPWSILALSEEARRGRDDDGVEILPVAVFLKDLWTGKLL